MLLVGAVTLCSGEEVSLALFRVQGIDLQLLEIH